MTGQIPSPVCPNWFYYAFAAALTLLAASTLAAFRYFRLSKNLKNTVIDYKRLGDALQESESLNRSILNASYDYIAITDIEGNIKTASPAGVTMFGDEHQVGHNIVELISPEDRERFLSNIKGIFSAVGEYRALRSDGSIIEIETNSHFTPNTERQPSSIVHVIRDITERKLKGQSCRVAMGKMISAIAHQWRQPLATLGIIVQRTHAIGNMHGLTEDSLDEFKASAMRQIRYMSDTIDAFRNFPHPDKQKELFSPLSCINDAVTLFGPQLTSSCVAVDLLCQGGDEPLVSGSPKEFKQVILNLLGNARDAIFESRSANCKPEEGRIRVLMSINAENYLTIDVSDNGCGIAPDIAQRIMEPYFTTKEESGGTGLGLYMSRMIVEESLGGRFCQIPCSEGATFRIELSLEKSS